MKFVSRSEWNATSPSGASNTIASKPKGTAVHWEGPKMGGFSHDKCANKVLGIQRFHMVTKGWSDIAYNYVVCPHGYVFEGRGLDRGSGANGTSMANYNYYAVCALTGEGDPTTSEMLDGIADAVGLCQTRAEKVVTGHRDHTPTACPGPELYAAVKAGRFSGGKVNGPASALPSIGVKPTPAKPANKPTPKAPKFPLPKGSYFGPKTGPAASVSGYFSHRTDLKKWQGQMKSRGWAIDVDGLYGANTEKVVRQFQAEKRLSVDGKIGPDTWAMAWKAPVT